MAVLAIFYLVMKCKESDKNTVLPFGGGVTPYNGVPFGTSTPHKGGQGERGATLVPWPDRSGVVIRRAHPKETVPE